MTRARGILTAFVLLGGALAPTVAYAQGEAAAQGETKFEIGFRTGFGLPLGKAAGDADDNMSSATAGQIPLWLDIGARIQEKVFVGGYFSYGFGFLGGDLADACDDADAAAAAQGASVSCSTSDMRLGAQGLYHFGPLNEGHAWLGGGIGYEWWKFGQSVEAGGQEQSITFTADGFEFLNVQVGGDFPVAKGFAVGPFLAFTLAQFGTVTASCSGDACGNDTSNSESIDDKALHHWLFLGVRGTVLP
ncbi:MAG TPA: hypothetical protein VMS65_00990 [Polyangiaceae bacterium]|nr:hypothetical protein [Polyangiaceae bacterium]